MIPVLSIPPCSRCGRLAQTIRIEGRGKDRKEVPVNHKGIGHYTQPPTYIDGKPVCQDCIG